MIRKLLVGAVGGAVLVGAVLQLWGTNLPRTTTAERTAELSAPVSEVYRLVTDVNGQAGWRSDVSQIQLSASGSAWEEHTKDGSVLTFHVLRKKADSLFIISYSSTTGFEGRWKGTFVPTSRGTRVRFIETVTIPNPLIRAVARLHAPAGSHLDQYLSDLKRAAEE